MPHVKVCGEKKFFDFFFVALRHVIGFHMKKSKSVEKYSSRRTRYPSAERALHYSSSFRSRGLMSNVVAETVNMRYFGVSTSHVALGPGVRRWYPQAVARLRRMR
jgi:hypothetical protein